MRIAAFVTAALCAGIALASPPCVNELFLPAGDGAEVPAPEAVPKVTRGQFLGVACAKVDQVASDSVEVVLYFAGNEPSTGIRGVLATDQTITAGTVHVRVPDMPELADHTIGVKVYYLDNDGKHTCDAGKVRVT